MNGPDLTPTEVAEHLQISARGVVDLIVTGVLEGYALNPKAERKRYRVPREALAEFKRRNSIRMLRAV